MTYASLDRKSLLQRFWSVDHMMTAEQAAARFGIRPQSVVNFAGRHNLGQMIGGKLRFTPSEVEYIRTRPKRERGWKSDKHAA